MKMRSGTGRLGEVIVARLAPGSDVYNSIRMIVEQHGIRSGLILGGAASLRKAVLRNLARFPNFPITDADRQFVKIEGSPLEMLSLNGNISTFEGRVWVHAHICVSSGAENGRSYGGHLVEGCEVLSTAEIAIARLDGIELLRLKDPETQGLELFFR
ncbi:MAG TPA: DNA-binding protein [Firmicutes bacterium]|nr:DNA-binding protein [Bacillota bacterium]